MSYVVFLRKSAEKTLKKLGAREQRHIYAALLDLSKEPRNQKCKKLSGTGNGYRAVVWPYRILYTINDAQKTVDVYLIAHRKEVYR